MKWTDLTLSLKDDHTSSLVPGSQQLSCLVEFHGGDDVSWKRRNGRYSKQLNEKLSIGDIGRLRGSCINELEERRETER